MSESDQFSGRTRIRGCALVISGESILLIKQAVPTRSHPIWLPPGGEVKMGESAECAATRETREEAGLDIQIRHLAAIHEFIEPPYHALELYFLATQKSGHVKIGKDPELPKDKQQIIDCKFVEFEKIDGINLYPEFLKKSLKQLITNTDRVIHIKSKDCSLKHS